MPGRGIGIENREGAGYEREAGRGRQARIVE